MLRSWEVAGCIPSMLCTLSSSFHSHSSLSHLLQGLTLIFPSAIMRICGMRTEMRCSLLYSHCSLSWCLSFKICKMEMKAYEENGWGMKQFFGVYLLIFFLLVATHKHTFCLFWVRPCVLQEKKPVTWLCGNFADVYFKISRAGKQTLTTSFRKTSEI